MTPSSLVPRTAYFRKRDVDQVYDDIAKEEVAGKPTEFAWDDDLPGRCARRACETHTKRLTMTMNDVETAGGGQFYCTESGRHFDGQKALDDHKKTREYKRR
jgi:bud site selection protein 20